MNSRVGLVNHLPPAPEVAPQTPLDAVPDVPLDITGAEAASETSIDQEALSVLSIEMPIANEVPGAR